MNTYLKKMISATLALLIAGTQANAETKELIPPPPFANPDHVSITTKTTTTQSSGRLWNLQDADIISVINEVSQETGKNFIVDPRINGKITLVSSKPLRRGEVYQVFLSVLGMLGYSAVPAGNVIKIIQSTDSGEQATAIATSGKPGHGDEVVVRVIPLENVSATQLIPIIRPLLPQWSNVASYAPGNVLILLGRAANLQRIMSIIEDVDKASSSGIQIIPLKRASAVQIANVLNNLQNAARVNGDTPVVSIAVDERSNSILLGGPRATRLRMRVLISQLDSPAVTPAGNTEVIYLRYLQAKTFAPILTKIAQNMENKDTPHFDNGNLAGNGVANLMPVAKPSNSTIQAEPSTNAIVITAQPALMQALKTVIAKLDIRPAEVMVEAIIAEIEEGDLTSLGIQWGSVNTSNYPPASSGVPTSFPKFGAGVLGIIPHVQIQAVLSLLRNQSGVDILSTPSIMVLDNQKASIEVGQAVPIQTGAYSTPSTVGSPPSPFVTNDYKNVTLKLEVTPQINLGNAVRLKIALKNDTLQNPTNPTLTPAINTSKIDNSVIINSDDILVLGGLISNKNNENTNKVPILSSVPIVGPLFVQKSSSQQKKNLVVFIKPTIIHCNDEALFITHTKYNAVRNVQANFRDNLTEIGDKPLEPKLPPWKNKQDLPTPFEPH